MTNDSQYWIHGASTVPEYTKHLTGHDNGLYFRPTGFGAKASQRKGTDNWFHLAIPSTPDEMGNSRFITNVWLRFIINKGAAITRIHIRQIALFDNSCPLIWDSGDIHISDSNTPWYGIDIGDFKKGILIQVHEAVVISVHVDFEAEGGEIWFVGAGAAFHTP